MTIQKKDDNFVRPFFRRIFFCLLFYYIINCLLLLIEVTQETKHLFNQIIEHMLGNFMKYHKIVFIYQYQIGIILRDERAAV